MACCGFESDSDSDFFHDVQINDICVSTIGPPDVFLFGNDSKCVRVKGFQPEVLISVPADVAVAVSFARSVICKELKIGFKDINVDLVRKKNAMGFEPEAQRYLRVKCKDVGIKNKIARKWSSRWGGPRLRDGDGDHRYSCANARVPLELQFLKLVKASPCGWVRVRGAEIDDEIAGSSSSRYNLVCDVSNVEGLDHSGISKPSVLSFDIECLGSGLEFPRAHNPQDKIIVVGCVFQASDSEITERAFCLGIQKDTDTARYYETESEVLTAFSEFVSETDPDIVTGYNICGFDIPYICDRLLLFGFFGKNSNTEVRMKQRAAHAKHRRYSEMAERHDKIDRDDDDARNEVVTLMNGLIDGKSSRSTFYRPPPPLWGLLAALDDDAKLLGAMRYFGKKKQTDVKFFENFGRKLKHLGQAKYVQKRLISSAMGVNTLGFIDNSGRGILDLYIRLKNSTHKLPDYKLNTVALHFLKDKKVDLPIQKMFDYWRSGELKLQSVVVEYCLKDCHLPLQIMDKLNTLYEIVEESRISCTPLPLLLVSGQSIRVRNHFIRRALDSGFAINDAKFEWTGKYEGATVIEPEKGFYDRFVCCHDFASLYPSIMIQFGLCPSNYYYCPKFPPKGALPVETGGRRHYFAREPGIVPPMLLDLLRLRREVKKMMKAETNPNQRSIFDARQRAIKIMCNSVYGFFGRRRGDLCCVAVSESTTAFGRRFIFQTKDAIEKKFGEKFDCEVIYGDTDSVMTLLKTSETLGAAWAIGETIGHYVNDVVFGDLEHIVIELEKIMNPYILFKKKRYISKSYESNDPDHFKLDYKGIELARRDNPQFIKGLLGDLLRDMTTGHELKRVAADCSKTVCDFLQKLANDELPAAAYVIKKTVRFNTKQKNLPHIQAALRHNARANSEPVLSGQRFGYVIWYDKRAKKKGLSSRKNASLSQTADDPDWVRAQKGLKIDRAYYVGVAKKVIERNLQFVLSAHFLRELIDSFATKIRLQLRGQRTMSQFFK